MEQNYLNPEALAIPIKATSLENSGTAKPVAKADRIQTIDMIRGFALLGILMMNIPWFGLDKSSMDAVALLPKKNWDYITASIIGVLFDGTMRGLFSMLFGAGMVLFMMNKKSKPGEPTVAELYFRRLLWLVAFGLLNAYVLLWTGDILFFYGICGLVLFTFRKLSTGKMFLLGAICIVINMTSQQLDWNRLRNARHSYLELKQAEKDKKEVSPLVRTRAGIWENVMAREVKDTAAVNENVREYRGNYITTFKHVQSENVQTEAFGTYFGLWDMLALMFIGIALFKLGFFTNRFSTSTYGILTLAGYTIGIALGWIYNEAYKDSLFSLPAYVDNYRTPGWTIYDFRRVALSVAHASLLMLIFRSKTVPWLMRALSNVGQMAFTNYLMQSIICTWFFFGYGLGNYEKLRFHQLYYVVLAVWIFQLIFSAIWLKFFRFGPFEWAWRSLTYWKRQPMKI